MKRYLWRVTCLETFCCYISTKAYESMQEFLRHETELFRRQLECREYKVERLREAQNEERH